MAEHYADHLRSGGLEGTRRNEVFYSILEIPLVFDI
jgi:hypothetical protein